MTTSQSKLFLDIHVIQTLPPSNINRDDTGSPKTAQYGGVRRARVSSQSWKRAMKTYFYDNSEQKNLGKLTKHVVEIVERKIREQNPSLTEKEALKLSKDILKLADIPTDGKTLFFIGNIESDKLAEAALTGVEDKDEVQQILRANPAIDIALFGRMLANDKDHLGVDASSQVAHAISTHAVKTEFDYFTAVDDEQEIGAGHLDTAEFNSSTLYRYANVALHEFLQQLGSKDSLVATLNLFIESFVKSLPTGKVNTFANQTVPQALIVTVRVDRPVNLVSAFEKPVKSSEGYVKESIEKLANEFTKVEKMVKKPALTFYVNLEEVTELSKVGTEKNSLPELLEDLSKELVNLMSE
ncbi:type I-E CRISPR-associated protein Cas7/Cse4/CasC [Streptococcus ratti]|uniref:Type I-E CRISPR-associated protein Cas7/Cse4/CasC n=1 Tax=Streptococcus ratti TaxID=1341 RepID=A0A7X9LEC2_STRRT|nr:type I-E CRISPR-associated protein Cas7/Cse4/CasC [Streptococcus ratti]NMD49267.1 type I-E CRISPR-associated protein Cas7/Cse4/CasC [Streptococcus ratti]